MSKLFGIQFDNERITCMVLLPPVVEVNVKTLSQSFDDRIIAIHHKTMSTGKHMFL